MNHAKLSCLFAAFAWLALPACGTGDGAGESDEAADDSSGDEGDNGNAGSGGAGGAGGKAGMAGTGGAGGSGGAKAPPPKDPDPVVDAGAPSMNGGTGGTTKDASPPVSKPDAAGKTGQLSRVLVFSRTTGFRHGSIEAGVKLIQMLGAANGFAVDHTEDPTKFTDDNLASYQVVVWLNTTGKPLDTEAQKLAFERFIRRGGGYVGTHSASDTWGGDNVKPVAWPWYGKLLGGDAFFDDHPLPQTQTLIVENRNTNATRHLPASFVFNEEWYDFETNPRPVVNVLLSLMDPRGGDHPITWYHEFDGGRAFYTGLGHKRQTFEDPRFQRMLLAAIKWAAGGEI